jgi:hypothetical protein
MMRLNIKESILTLLDVNPARRNFTSFSDDIYLAVDKNRDAAQNCTIRR